MHEKELQMVRNLWYFFIYQFQFGHGVGRSSYYDLGVSNYILYPMEKKNFCIVTILVFLTCLCDSDYHTYDNYQYDEYNYNENYDYNNQKPEDYTEDQ